MAKLTKWGNSMGGFRLPKAIIEAAELRVGDEVSCHLLDNGTILLTPIKGITCAAAQVMAADSTRPTLKW